MVNGIIRIAAMDQRGSLKKMLNKDNPKAVTYEELRDAKLMLCEVLAPHASAVLLDPEYAASEAIATGVLPGDTGLLVSLEKSGYLQEYPPPWLSWYSFSCITSLHTAATNKNIEFCHIIHLPDFSFV